MPQYKKVFDVGTYAGVSGYTRVGIPTLRTPGSGGKQVAKSLRFRAANSAQLTRTFGTPTSLTTWTLSLWVKRGALGSAQYIAHSRNAGNTVTWEYLFQSDNTLIVRNYTGSAYDGNYVTTRLFNDPSVWNHLVLVWDTTNATASNRVRIYVNGDRVSAFSTASTPSSSVSSVWNTSGYGHGLFGISVGGATVDGYLAEPYFIDGQAYDPTYFGEYNSDNIWVPKAYSGSYTGNSFYLPLTDTTSTTTIVSDSSGRGNNWTASGISLTAGTTYDSMYDSPTDYDNSVYGAGNYAVLNPLTQASTAISNGNLAAIASGFSYADCDVTFSPEGLKGYFEFTISTTDARIGFIPKSVAITGSNYTNSSGFVISPYYNSVDQGNSRFINSYFTGSTANDIIGCAFDFTGSNRNVWWSRNGTWGTTSGGVGNPATGANPALTATNLNAGPYRFYNAPSNATTVNFNFGQRNFNTAPPSGFSALNTKNITRPTDANMWFYGDTPDLMWIKNRSATSDHSLTDTVRGVGLGLSSNQATAEQGAQDVAEMNKFGMTLIGASSRTTAASNNFVYWVWKGGGTTPTTGTGTGGITNVQYSANVSSGFSIVTYTGSGTTGTVTHGLGVTPSMVIVKGRQNTNSWMVKHSSTPSNTNLFLSGTDANYTTPPSGYISDLSSSSTVTLTTGSAGSQNVNTSGERYVMYCLAPIAGYSAFGSYTGNGSATGDGPFIYTGFRPKYVLRKRTDTIAFWVLHDATRDPYNVTTQDLYPNDPLNEASDPTIDFVANGFKIRGTAGANLNALNGTYIYAAFAEHPFKISRAR